MRRARMAQRFVLRSRCCSFRYFRTLCGGPDAPPKRNVHPVPVPSDYRPPASSAGARATMRANRRRDTAPEMTLRRELHRRGLRFRVDYPPVPGLQCRADVVFTKARLAIFVDGCFWHGCAEHGNLPRANRRWWQEKLELNVARDRRNDIELADAGWTVIRFWEHEPLATAADRVCQAVAAASGTKVTLKPAVRLPEAVDPTPRRPSRPQLLGRNRSSRTASNLLEERASIRRLRSAGDT